MSFTENCEVCKKELTGKFVWVKCDYFGYHPTSECGGCTYPVGTGCIKKIPAEYRGEETTVKEWYDELERHKLERHNKEVDSDE